MPRCAYNLPFEEFVGNANRAKEVTEVRQVESFFLNRASRSPTNPKALASYYIPVMRVKLDSEGKRFTEREAKVSKALALGRQHHLRVRQS